MKILLIGNGAREHCIAASLVKSGRAKLFAYGKAKNPGIFELAQEYQLGSLSNFPAILDFAKKVKPDFAFIGPDDPIGDGVADLLLTIGIHSVAPLKTVARLESSKSFTRDLVKKYKIPGNPDFKVFYEKAGIADYLKKLGGNFVVKADGLMGGKGVLVSGEHLKDSEEGEQYAENCIKKFGRVVIEEKLIGQEFSLMSFVDGKNVVDMVPVQDHKRAFDGDLGPNTGGMGSYSDADHLLPFLTKKDLEDAHAITEKVASALFAETGVLFKGIMYGGFMATAKGVSLIEYNARFGDPEVMNVLPIMKTDLIEVCEGILSGDLKRVKVEFEKKATVCKYIVPEGYPEKPRVGEKIFIDAMSLRAHATKSSPVVSLRATAKQSGLGDRLAPAVSVHAESRPLLFYSSVDKREDGLYLSSSRAVAFVGIGDDLESAEKIAQSACATVKGPVFYRKDVGTQALIQKRVEMMRKLRG